MRTTVFLCPECKEQFKPRMEVMPNMRSDWRTCASCGQRVDITKLVESRPIHATRGYLGGQPYPYPISYVPIGTFSGINSTGAVTIATVSVPATCALVACMATDITAGGLDNNSLKWNGTTLTLRSSALFGTAGQVAIYSLSNNNPGSGTFAFVATAITIPSWSITLFALTNSGTQSRSGAAAGADTTPDSGLTTLPTLTDTEMLVGAVAFENTANSGNWNEGYTEGQFSAGATYSINDGYKGMRVRGKFSAGKNGCTNNSWGASICTYKVR